MWASITNIVLFVILIAFSLINYYIEIIVYLQSFKYNKFENHTVEYIVVGTGTAGSVILSAIQSDSVLALEAGVYHTSFILDVPLFTPSMLTSAFDWNYATMSQTEACKGLNDRKSRWPRGKLYGGTHILNNMIHHRGHPEDYRGWFSSDIDNYNYRQDIEPFFDKHDEKLKISHPKFVSKLSKAFVGAGNDHFDGHLFSAPNLTQNNGRRWTTSHHNYYNMQAGRTVLTDARVTQLLFDQNRVVGVQYYSQGKYSQVFASKGVILSGGVIETPKLLMLSGIGNKHDLNALDIKCIKELPVGQNLQDHITTGMDLVLINQTLETSPTSLLSLRHIFDYYFYGSGPLTHGGCDGIGFANSGYNKTVAPDISFLLMPFGVSTDGGAHFRKILNINDDLWNDYFRHFTSHSVVSILPILLHPKSRGTVKIASKNPFEPPFIDPQYLTHEDDVRTLVRSMRMLQKILTADVFRPFNAELNPKHFPGCGKLEFNTDGYWECYVRHLTLTMYHPVGTCAMGGDDTNSVVDYHFRVHGFENLFVVDASIMPNSVSGNPNAAIGILAHKFLNSLQNNFS